MVKIRIYEMIGSKEKINTGALCDDFGCVQTGIFSTTESGQYYFDVEHKTGALNEPELRKKYPVDRIEILK
ncbi:MAG: hypothetical protein JW754_03160 [Candidatus Aenigmarchaeota archaeon]|nr:hypothetical protein [Candidatus Aenigmarchaeota archaeon]